MDKKIVVIGSGFSSLAAATVLASEGFEVKVLEKNDQCGGRARTFSAEGFRFDMGPSWYWMPDVFEDYFALFNKKVSDYYELKRLDPSYKVFFAKDDTLNVPADYTRLKTLFESLEMGSSAALDKFLKEAEHKYKIGMNELVYEPGLSLMEFSRWKIVTNVFRLQLFSSISKHIRQYFNNEKLIQLLEFPVLFLGAKPNETPALYSLMNYADIQLGTWYPSGGMHKIVEGMVDLAKEEGVEFMFNCNVERLNSEKGKIVSAQTSSGEIKADFFISGADYQHTDQELLAKADRNYDENYWNNRKLAPSSLIFYLGIDKRLQGLEHHNLFFDESFQEHAKDIYDQPRWPSKPLFYVSMTSKTDHSVAPKGHENLFILIPVAPGLKDNEETRAHYYELVMDRLEHLTDQEIKSHVIFKRSYAHLDFIKDYNAFKGNAYGLANTLKQTAILKPSIKSKKMKNLFFTGQLTTPGPGVPPSLISGQVVANQVLKSIY